MILFVGFLAMACVGYWLAQSAVPEERTVTSSQPVAKPPIPAPDLLRAKRASDRAVGADLDSEARDAGALANQRVLLFADQAALEDFLRRNAGKVLVMGRLDSLNALRVRFGAIADLRDLLTGNEETAMIFPVDTPQPPAAFAQEGAVALGSRLLEWLGIRGDNSNVGKGIRFAVLDTGVTAHASFLNRFFQINLIGLPADPSTQNGHGTAVASMILGSGGQIPGIAPGAELVSFRIADDFGRSDSFRLAEGIIAAVDAKVAAINISMGSYGDSAVVRAALAYARDAGVVVVAAAGNDGQGRVMHPGADSSVVGVAAVDGTGNRLDFSNYGEGINLAAPGFGVNAAWTEDRVASVNGTSFSAPIVTGSILYVMDQQGVSATRALELIMANLNDGGAAGPDAYLGAGMPALDRVAYAGQAGIYDAAVASQRLLPADAKTHYPRVEVVVQNRGTEPLVNSVVTAGGYSKTIPSLAPNASTTIVIPVSQSQLEASDSLQFSSQVTVSPSVADINPTNDRRSEALSPQPTQP